MTILREYKTVPLSSIKPYANNPRNNEAAVEGVMRSIERLGYIAPIVVDENMEVLAGHTRYAACTNLNKVDVDVLIARGLTEEQKIAYRLADNRLGENAKWDESKLADELRLLQEFGFDLGGTGFDASELDCLLDTISADCLDDLTVSNVCGDVLEKPPSAQKTVRVSIGAHRFMVSLDTYNEWNAKMVFKYKERSALINAIAKKLEFPLDKITVVSSGDE